MKNGNTSTSLATVSTAESIAKTKGNTLEQKARMTMAMEVMTMKVMKVMMAMKVKMGISRCLGLKMRKMRRRWKNDSSLEGSKRRQVYCPE